MTMTTWRTDSPARAGWFNSDHDPDLRRYFDGAAWSAPLHRDDLDRIGERVGRTPAEPRDDGDPIEWRDD